MLRLGLFLSSLALGVAAWVIVLRAARSRGLDAVTRDAERWDDQPTETRDDP